VIFTRLFRVYIDANSLDKKPYYLVVIKMKVDHFSSLIDISSN